MVRTLKRGSRRHTKHTAVTKTRSKSRSHSRSRSKSKTRTTNPISVVVHKTHTTNHRATAKKRSPSKYYYDPEEGRYLGKIEVVIHGKSRSKSKSRRRPRV